MGTTNTENRNVQGGPAIPTHLTNETLPPPAANTVHVVRQEQYSAPVSGELQGVTSATQLPNVSCKFVKLKARANNAGNVYIGPEGVTKPNGSTDTTTGLELAPGDDSGWIPLDNMNRLYRICDNTGDALTYLVLR